MALGVQPPVVSMHQYRAREYHNFGVLPMQATFGPRGVEENGPSDGLLTTLATLAAPVNKAVCQPAIESFQANTCVHEGRGAGAEQSAYGPPYSEPRVSVCLRGGSGLITCPVSIKVVPGRGSSV